MAKKLIYRFFILLFLVISYGCQQKIAKERLNVSSKIGSVKTSKKIINKSSTVEKSAVIYRSNDMGLTCCRHLNQIKKLIIILK